MFEKVRELVAKQMKIDPETIKPESRLVEDLKADSIDAAELIINLENELDVELADEAILNVKTVEDIVKYLEAAVVWENLFLP